MNKSENSAEKKGWLIFCYNILPKSSADTPKGMCKQDNFIS